MIVSETDSLPQLPPDSQPLVHQVAGHFYGRSKTKFGLLQRCSTGDVLKPLLNPPRGPREEKFYEEMFSAQISGELASLRPFLPKLLGKIEFDGMKYLVLENILRPFRRPCVMDIKLGRITYDQEATPEEAQRRILKFIPATEIGFQVLGWKTFRSNPNVDIYHDKICSRALTKDELLYALANFFGAPEFDHRSLVRHVVKRLEQLDDVMSKQFEYTFIASSLLISYDAEDRTEDIPSTNVDVRLVDFAHVFPSTRPNEPDENFLFGLRHCIDYCHRLLDPNFVYVNCDKFDHHSSSTLSTCRKVTVM